MKPQIVSVDFGVHNSNLDATRKRLERESSYKDLSTIVVIPCIGTVPVKVVASWWSMIFPPNQKVVRFFPTAMEVGAAYSQCIEAVLDNPDLSKFKYLLTLEHDNIPPPDGFVKLVQRMEEHPEFDCIGGLYFTKGEGGCAQIWGDPRDPQLNFRPQLPDPAGGLVECCGTGMGFNLWRLDMFKDKDLRRPWFETRAGVYAEGAQSYTQDLWAWTDFRKNGYRCAIDCSVRVGHYDLESDISW